MKKSAFKQLIVSIQSQADDLYMGYVKKMKALDKLAHSILEKAEKKKASDVRKKIKKLA
jgi:hypothetical protein